jgi:subtilisin
MAWCVAIAMLVLLEGATNLLFAQAPQNYIIAFREDVIPATRAMRVRAAGATVRFNYRRVAAVAATVPSAAVLAALRADPLVADVVPDRSVSVYQTAKGKPGGNGGGSSQVVPAGVLRVRPAAAGSDGSGIGVAIVDTGIDLTHPDLAGTANAFSAFGASCQDNNGHGTHVAGTVAARDNAIDVVGVAPAARLYCVKVLDGSGSGSDATVMAGLEWVLEQARLVTPVIKVVNMSLGRAGSVDDNPLLRVLIEDLDAAGISVVVAAGNDPSLDVSQQIPAAYPEVISVASTTGRTGSNQCRFLSSPIAADTASYFTTDGIGVTISAPGEEQENVNRGCWIESTGILSTRLGGGTTRMSGTSMAAPHVAGVVARYYQKYAGEGYTPLTIRQYLKADAVATVGTAPLDSPSSSYTFDHVREGIALAPAP